MTRFRYSAPKGTFSGASTWTQEKLDQVNADRAALGWPLVYLDHLNPSPFADPALRGRDKARVADRPESDAKAGS